MAESFAKIPRRAARYRASGQAHSVLISVASHANKDGFAYPSLSLMASETRIERKNIPRLISQLEAVGLLRRELRLIGDRWRNGYVVLGVLNSEDEGVSSELSQGVLNSEKGAVLKIEPPYREEEQTNFNRPGRDHRAREKRSPLNDNQNRPLACGASAPLPAVVTAEEKARRKAIWQTNIINYAQDTMTSEEFRAWCPEFIEHNDNKRHWSVKRAWRLHAEMKARRLRSGSREAAA